MADAGGTTARGWFRRSRRDPHPRQRAGRSIRRLYGIRSRCPAGRRTAARAHTGARDPAAWRRRRDRYRPGAHLGAAGGDCDGLRHTGIQAAGRAFQDVRHLRCRDAAARSCGARGDRPARRHALGHRAPLSLRPVDARPSPPLRRPRSAAQTEDDARQRSTAGSRRCWRSGTTCFPGPATSIASTHGKACSRRRLTACPTSARTGTIRGTSLRSATAGTG